LALAKDNSLLYQKDFSDAAYCDVLVSGGGMAGVAAAITAARTGASTMLLEQYGFLGGFIVSWGDMCFCGDTTGVGGVFDEIIREMEQLDAIAAYVPFEPEKILDFDHASWVPAVARWYDANVLRIVLAQMVRREPNLQVLLHSKFVDVIHDDGRVNAVVFHNVDGPQAIKARGVIDCTGDAYVAQAAGSSCTKGHETRSIPMASRLTLRDVGRKVTPVLPDWGHEYKQRCDMRLTHLSIEKDGVAIFRNNVIGYDAVDAEELTEAELISQTDMLNIVQHMQRHGYESYVLDSLNTQIWIRFCQRIVGEYVLTKDDAKTGATFNDAIARGTCNLTTTFLDPEKIIRPQNELEVEVVPPYQIPYRCMLPRSTENVLVAGRCISADGWSLSSARQTPACAMTGQAAGLAAAQAVATNVCFRDVDIAALQRELKKLGAKF